MSTIEKKEAEFCQQCPNHCQVSALKCGRGRKFFGISTEGEHHGNRQEHNKEKRKVDSDSLYGLMRGCGHFLHHSSMTNEKDAISMEEQLFSCLNGNEQKLLKELLTKLQKNWNNM